MNGVRLGGGPPVGPPIRAATAPCCRPPHASAPSRSDVDINPVETRGEVGAAIRSAESMADGPASGVTLAYRTHELDRQQGTRIGGDNGALTGAQ